MVFIYGWLSLQDEDEGNEQIAVSTCISQMINVVNSMSLGLKWNQVKLAVDNGIPYLLVAQHLNHRTEVVDELLTFFQRVEHLFPQSYGSIYLLDDDVDDTYPGGKMILYSRGGQREVISPFEEGRFFCPD